MFDDYEPNLRGSYIGVLMNYAWNQAPATGYHRVNDWKEFQTTMDKLIPAIDKIRVSLREAEEMICI